VIELVGYIDAGSGSYLLTAIASGAAGLWFLIRSRIGPRKDKKASSEAANEPRPSNDG